MKLEYFFFLVFFVFGILVGEVKITQATGQVKAVTSIAIIDSAGVVSLEPSIKFRELFNALFVEYVETTDEKSPTLSGYQLFLLRKAATLDSLN